MSGLRPIPCVIKRVDSGSDRVGRSLYPQKAAIRVKISAIMLNIFVVLLSSTTRLPIQNPVARKPEDKKPKPKIASAA